MHSCLFAIVTRPNFHEQPHFILYNYSLLSLASPAFFTSITLFDWKPLSWWTLHFLVHSSCRTPRVFLSVSIASCVSLSFSPSPIHLKTDRLSFLRQCDLFLSLSLEAFVHVPFLPPRDSRESPAVPNSSHLPFVASRFARAEISPYIKSGS